MTAPIAYVDLQHLLRSFESLGENCDFGFVQRAFAIETLGLLRFAGCKAATVLKMLQTRLAGFAVGDDIAVELRGPNNEFAVISRSYAYTAHTFVHRGQDDLPTMLRVQTHKLRLMKGQFLQDLSRGERIYLLKAPETPDIARRVGETLRDYGDNRIVLIGLADAQHRAGSVERASATELRGYVSRDGTYVGGRSFPLVEWIDICVAAHRLLRGAAPPSLPEINLIATADAQGSCRWSSPGHAVMYRMAGDPHVGTYDCHLWTRDEKGVVRAATLTPAVAGRHVLSAWIRLPAGFSGGNVGLHVLDTMPIQSQAANPAMRETWQLVWVCVEVRPDHGPLQCVLFATGHTGDLIHSAGWSLEAGSMPSGWGILGGQQRDVACEPAVAGAGGLSPWW